MIFLLTILATVFQTGWTGVNEHSFIAVKPDGVHRRLVGEIIQRFEKKGFRLVGMKLVQASEDLVREHYWDLRDKPFFNGLVRYMSSGPIVAMVWQGLDVVKMSRKMLGETNPADSLPGTIRGDYCVEVGRNVIHGSDSVESAQREISLWFRQNELQCWEDTGSMSKQESEVKEIDKVMYHDWRLVPKHEEEQFKLYNPVPEPPIRYVSYPPLLRAMLLAQRQKDKLGAAVEEPTLPLKRDVLLSKEYFRSQEKERERERQEGTAV